MVSVKNIRGKDVINLQEWDREELEVIFNLSFDLKRKYVSGEKHRLLEEKTLVMLFYNPSTRTRLSLETGMTQLGGHAIYLPSQSTWVKFEAIKDTAQVLSRYGDALAIRLFSGDLAYGGGNQILREYAKWCNIPVINMEDGMYHPLQGLADLMTIREKFSRIENKKFVLSWTYSQDPTLYLGSECHTNVMLMTQFGMDVTLAHPEGFDIDKSIVQTAKRNADKCGSKFEVSNDVREAYQDADVVYPVNWTSWKYLSAGKKDDLIEYAKKYKNWTCSQELMDLTAKNSIYMHPLPVTRGEEVTDEVIDGPHSVVYDEAENRLHAQKALLVSILGGLH